MIEDNYSYIDTHITLRDGSEEYSIWQFLNDKSREENRVYLPDGQYIDIHEKTAWGTFVHATGRSWDTHSQEDAFALAKQIVETGITLGYFSEDTNCHYRLTPEYIDPFQGEEFISPLDS